ncbi:hypothetical protein [Bradyrhizobium sp. CCBAU 51753]|uniref:hypothetical protein n=1 Tax=Bradyrhizobium sp. CCBAU 51753 TaxID=1325100 RepID=UPI00188B21DA|nr:hypothetical protein [Bradyrhizobium sp. CCBAU 51753]
MDSHHSAAPELAGPSLMPARSYLGVGGGVLAAILALSCALYAFPAARTGLKAPPATAEELSAGVVTVVAPEDSIGIKSAIAAVDVPETARSEIARAVQTNQRQMAWLVFVDSMDPDGDVVAVRASGLTQNITLSKAWTPVAVPISPGSPIEVTGVRDGLGGGITVALATRNGPMTLRILSPGETLEVMP